ncbi:MAG: PKD domain-containing protein [Chitinophagaceae bacterium]
MRITTILFILLCMAGVSSCKKDNPNMRPADIFPNTVPLADAGEDQFLELPLNETTISGSYSDAENNVVRVKWVKISGPETFTIVDQSALSTVVKNLQHGVYRFVLIVTDAGNLSGKDTVIIKVGNLPTNPNELLFKELDWAYNWDTWGTHIEIKNIYDWLDGEKISGIFLKGQNRSDWIKVIPFDRGVNTSFYLAYIIGGLYSSNQSLYIIYNGNDVLDRPDIRIVY